MTKSGTSNDFDPSLVNHTCMSRFFLPALSLEGNPQLQTAEVGFLTCIDLEYTFISLTRGD